MKSAKSAGQKQEVQHGSALNGSLKNLPDKVLIELLSVFQYARSQRAYFFVEVQRG